MRDRASRICEIFDVRAKFRASATQCTVGSNVSGHTRAETDEMNASEAHSGKDGDMGMVFSL